MKVAARLSLPKSWHEVPGNGPKPIPSRRVRYDWCHSVPALPKRAALSGSFVVKILPLPVPSMLSEPFDHTVPTGTGLFGGGSRQ